MVGSTSGASNGGNIPKRPNDKNIEIPKRLTAEERKKHPAPSEIKTTYKSHEYQQWTQSGRKADLTGKYYISREEQVIVEAVQEKLNITVDGVFGDKETKPAIMKFQKDHGLPENGELTPETYEAIMKEKVAVKKGEEKTQTAAKTGAAANTTITGGTTGNIVKPLVKDTVVVDQDDFNGRFITRDPLSIAEAILLEDPYSRSPLPLAKIPTIQAGNSPRPGDYAKDYAKWQKAAREEEKPAAETPATAGTKTEETPTTKKPAEPNTQKEAIENAPSVKSKDGSVTVTDLSAVVGSAKEGDAGVPAASEELQEVLNENISGEPAQAEKPATKEPAEKPVEPEKPAKTDLPSDARMA